MATATGAMKRQRGEIEELPSGSLRVKVYAGIDPIIKKRHYLTGTIPAGPSARREAEKARPWIAVSPAHQAEKPGMPQPGPHPPSAAEAARLVEECVTLGELDRPEPLRYVQVEPSVVAEIEVDTAFEHRRWRHRVRYVRPRLDLSVYGGRCARRRGRPVLGCRAGA